MSTTESVEISDKVHRGQAEFLDSPARFRILACGRRWGKTEACAIEARDDLLEGGPEFLAWWVSPTYQQSEIGFRKFRRHFPEELVEDVNRTKRRITTVFGNTIAFKSADQPDNLRGEGVDLLIVDEAAEVSQYAWENALRPTLTDSADSRMVAISTPQGRNWFHRLYERGQSDDWPDYESWNFPSKQNPFISHDDVDDARRTLPDRVYRQEYLAEFVDESGGVFKGLEERLFTADYDVPLDPDEAEPPFAIGVDFARHQDYRVTVVLDATGRVVYFDRDQHEAWPHIQQAIEDVAADYEGIVNVDGSRDNKIVADLADAGVNVNPVSFSPKRKRELVEDLVARIENGELTGPEIPQLRHELEIFEYDVTTAGNVRYHAPEGFHDDCVDALALASSALDRLGVARRRQKRAEESDSNGVSYL